MSLQRRYLCKFPVSSMFSSAAPELSVSAQSGAGLLRGGQELLPLKVARIQASVTTAFHLQSRRGSDCQMWELVCFNKKNTSKKKLTPWSKLYVTGADD